MVATRQRNKGTHPGLVDLNTESNRRSVSTSETKVRLVKTSDAMNEIKALEAKLLTEHQERSGTAREPPGPGVTRQPRTSPTLVASQRLSPNPNPPTVRDHGT